MFDELLTASSNSRKPIISAVICTYNRASLLVKVLESLCKQTLPTHNFEVIIINDGSVDDTEAVAITYAQKLPIRYIYQRNAGLASAKNHGLFACLGDIVLFLDDDDVAMETLLEEHVKTHKEFPAEHYAVLGYTGLSPDISINPLMHFVTMVGHFLFSYSSLKHGDILDTLISGVGALLANARCYWSLERSILFFGSVAKISSWVIGSPNRVCASCSIRMPYLP